MCSDGAGGCYITIEQNGGYPESLVLLRLNSHGYKAWGSNVRLLGSLPEQFLASPINDGENGVIVCYHDDKITGTPDAPIITERLLVQRVDSSGNILWASAGMRVTLSDTLPGNQSIVSDGTGGCIVAWNDAAHEMWVQRISAEGGRMWGDSGIFLGHSQERAVLSVSALSGALVEYYAYPDGPYYVQRINLAGSLLWNNGVILATEGSRTAFDQSGCSYHLGGTLFGIYNGLLDFRYSVQKLDSTGRINWDITGVILDTVIANNRPASDLISSEDLVYASWPQLNAGIWDIKTQIIRPDGSRLLPAGGEWVSTFPSERRIIGLVGSPPRGSVYVWWDGRSGTGTYAQLVDTAGRRNWDSTDIALCLPALDYANVTTDGNGGCIVVGLRGSDYSIRAQQVSRNGNLGEIVTSSLASGIHPPDQFQLHECYPNPFNSSTMISYTLPRTAFVALKVFDILGRQVTTLVESTQRGGLHRVRFNGDELPSGVYIVRMEIAGRGIATKKVSLLR